MIDFFWDR